MFRSSSVILGRNLSVAASAAVTADMSSEAPSPSRPGATLAA